MAVCIMLRGRRLIFNRQNLQNSCCLQFEQKKFGSKFKSSSAIGKQTPAEYCLDLVRKYDYENFLCTLLLPKETRAAAFAIRAFNIEIAQVRDIVTNRDIGKMRMQFWKDSIETIFQGSPPQQPVAMELCRILEKQKLTKQWFRRLIESREAGLGDRCYEKISELEEYSEKSVSSIYYLILESAGIKNIHADHTASHLGKAQGISILLRGTPFNASRTRVYLPQDLMLKHKVSQENILRRKGDQSMKDLTYEIACVAHQHLKIARSFKSELSKEARHIFLPAIGCHSYLTALEKQQFDLFHPQLQVRNMKLPLIFWWHKWFSDF